MSTNPGAENADLNQQIRELARDGMKISDISKKLGISWQEAHTLGWIGAKQRITIRLNKLAKEPDPEKRKMLAEEADLYVDFIFDAAKHLRSQVNAARKALNR